MGRLCLRDGSRYLHIRASVILKCTASTAHQARLWRLDLLVSARGRSVIAVARILAATVIRCIFPHRGVSSRAISVGEGLWPTGTGLAETGDRNECAGPIMGAARVGFDEEEDDEDSSNSATCFEVGLMGSMSHVVHQPRTTQTLAPELNSPFSLT